MSCVTKTENICLLPLSDSKRQSKPQQSTNANNISASRRCNDVDSMVKSSKLSASAPEFVPSGFNPYDVRGILHYHCLYRGTSYNVFYFVCFIFYIIS